MEELEEYTLEYKEDVHRVPEGARVLRVECKLSEHAARKILEKCRELEKIVFAGHAYALMEEGVAEYLRGWVFVEIEGEHTHHGVPEEKAERIRELYARGDYHLDQLSREFVLPKNVIWHIVHEKHPKSIRTPVSKNE